jgi:hypothetical protein
MPRLRALKEILTVLRDQEIQRMKELVRRESEIYECIPKAKSDEVFPQCFFPITFAWSDCQKFDFWRDGPLSTAWSRVDMGSVNNAELKSRSHGCAPIRWCSAVSIAEKTVGPMIHDLPPGPHSHEPDSTKQKGGQIGMKYGSAP